jgi:hypothetical protein
MKIHRVAAAAVLCFIVAAGAASAQCVSEVRQIASRSSSPSLVANDTAWSGSILAVASHQSKTPASVYVTFYDEHGTQLYPSTKLPSTADAEIIGLVWTGQDFGLFLRTTDDELILRRIATTGELTGGAIEPLSKLTFADDQEFDLLWSARLQAYVIARTVPSGSQKGLWLTYINLDGTVRSNVNIAMPVSDSLVRVAETETGIIGVFFERDANRDLMMISVHEGQLNVLRQVWTPGDDLVVTAFDGVFAMARTGEAENDRKIIRWQLVDSAGFEVRDEARLLIGSGKDVAPLSLIWNGSELALTYLDSREGFNVQTPSYRIRRFDAVTGEVFSDTYFAAADRTRHRAQTKHDAIWTGTAYIAAAVRDTEDGDDSFLLRLCPLQAHIAAPRTVERGTTVTFNGSGEGGVPEYAYAWHWYETDNALGQTNSIRFDSVGDFPITLTVTDDSGMRTTTTFTVTVFDPGKQRRRGVRH